MSKDTTQNSNLIQSTTSNQKQPKDSINKTTTNIQQANSPKVNANSDQSQSQEASNSSENSSLFTKARYDDEMIRNILVVKGISLDHILPRAASEEELLISLEGIREEDSFYIIPLNVDARTGEFGEPGHWVGLYIETKSGSAEIDSVKYLNPTGAPISPKLRRFIFEKTNIAPEDITFGKGIQFGYFEDIDLEFSSMKGNDYDCGPMLIHLLHELYSTQSINERHLGEVESKQFGQELRQEHMKLLGSEQYIRLLGTSQSSYNARDKTQDNNTKSSSTSAESKECINDEKNSSTSSKTGESKQSKKPPFIENRSRKDISREKDNEHEEKEQTQHGNQEKINYVNLGNKARSIEFNAQKTAEGGHPEEKGFLSDSISEVLKDTSVKDLTEFHTQVYKLLRQNVGSKDVKYVFKDQVTHKGKQIEIWQSENLIFWLIANKKYDELKKILTQYKFDINTVQDNHGNNILHIAALYGGHEFINHMKNLFYKEDTISIPSFKDLMNHRNHEGTNPLGMIFLNKLPNETFIKAVELFISNPHFEVNSYLNNKKGMDVLDKGFFKQIGGFNILHMALANKYPEILEMLYGRYSQDINDPNWYVNFRYPALNPDCHMYSPRKILDKTVVLPTIDPELAEKQKKCRELLEDYQKKQLEQEDEDGSGDSDDEDSSAYVWKHVLIDMVESDSIPKQEGTYCMPLFHGVPLMAGLYTHSDRKYVGKKLMLLNPGITDKTREIIQRQLEEDEDTPQALKAIHSRSSTASAGLENLAKVFKADSRELKKLDEIDKILKTELHKTFQKKPGIFREQIKKFVNSFASETTHKDVWKSLTSLNEDLISDLIIKYRFPFISTSKTPEHGTKYGFGINLELPRGEGKLEPRYDSEGKPKHRLAGFLYIIKEEANTLQAKLASGEIFDVNSLEGINTRYQNQIEVAFLGGINQENIIAIIPLIYLNFSKDLNEDYHQNIFGFSESEYTKAQESFCRTQVRSNGLVLSYEKGAPNVHYAWLSNIFVHLAEKIALKFSGGNLVTQLFPGSSFIEYITNLDYTLSTNDYTSPNHKMIRQSTSKSSPSPREVEIVSQKLIIKSSKAKKLTYEKRDENADKLPNEEDPYSFTEFSQQLSLIEKVKTPVAVSNVSMILERQLQPLSSPNPPLYLAQLIETERRNLQNKATDSESSNNYHTTTTSSYNSLNIEKTGEHREHLSDDE